MELTKKQLKDIADHLGVEVEAKKKNKPTSQELMDAVKDHEDLEKAMEELEIVLEEDEEELDTEIETSKANIYTYVGKGESSPKRINFMGRQEFIIGRPAEVTDPNVLAKIKGNPTFIQGEADPELLQDIEDEGTAIADKNRSIDAQMDDNFKRQHGGS